MNNEKKTDNNFQALCVKRAKMVAMAITFYLPITKNKLKRYKTKQTKVYFEHKIETKVFIIQI